MSTSIQGAGPDGNPIVFMDVSLGPVSLGRIKILLFADALPKTCENFRQFCTGEYKINTVPQGYKKSKFHRIMRNFMMQGGDFVKGDGTGSMSIYGSNTFPDEGFKFPREPGFYKQSNQGVSKANQTRRSFFLSDEAFSVSMANSGPDTNGCQFFIACTALPHLDKKHVVFGKVIEGQDIVRRVEHVPTGANDMPYPNAVTITECGEM